MYFMRLTSKNIGSWGIFEIDGTVDSVHTRIFIDALAAYLNNGHRNIIIDLAKAPFLSIGAIRYINQVSQNLESAGGRMALMGANDRIRRHIDIFVSWKKLREINSIWEVIPLQMNQKLAETPGEILVDNMDDPKANL